MDDTLLANISDEQIDDTLNDESEEQIAKLNKAMKKLDADERAVMGEICQKRMHCICEHGRHEEQGMMENPEAKNDVREIAE